VRTAAAGLERAAIAMLRSLGAGRAFLLMPQPAAATGQTGLGMAPPQVNELEVEPVLLQSVVSGKTLLALATRNTVRRAIGTGEEIDPKETLERSMLRAGEAQYRIVAVTVKRFGGAELLYELEIEA